MGVCSIDSRPLLRRYGLPTGKCQSRWIRRYWPRNCCFTARRVAGKQRGKIVGSIDARYFAMKRRAHRPLRAFTLIELLVAVTIGVLLVALLIAVASSATNLWARASGRIATAATARAVLDQIESDLQCAVFREDGNVWFAATVLTATNNSGIWVTSTSSRPSGESLVLTEPSIDENRFGAAGTWLRFFTDVGGQRTANLRAVAYQIVRRGQSTASGAEVAYLLFRSVVTDANTFTAGYNLDPVAGGYTSASATSGNPGNVIRPPLDTVLADHVVDFGVRFFRYDASDLQPLFPAVNAVWTNAELSHFVRLGPAGSSETVKPDVVEVMVRVLTEDGVRLLRNFENPPGGYVRSSTWWDIVTKNSHVYSRRIVLNQGTS